VRTSAYVSEHDYGLDVTFFPAWLQGITSKPVEKSWNGLFWIVSLLWTLLAGRVGMGERRIMGTRAEGFQMGEGQTWFELRVGSFGMPRTRAAVPRSARARAALMRERALEWLTKSTKARWLVAALEIQREQVQNKQFQAGLDSLEFKERQPNKELLNLLPWELSISSIRSRRLRFQNPVLGI